MDASVHEPTNGEPTPEPVAPLESDSFVDTVLDLAHERAGEALRPNPNEVLADETFSQIDFTAPGLSRGRRAGGAALVAPVKIVDFVQPALPAGPEGPRFSNWRRLRRSWREWRIGRTPRHRHTLGQRLQYRWWRHQDRVQRRRAQGHSTQFDLLKVFLWGAVLLAVIVVVVYLTMFAA